MHTYTHIHIHPAYQGLYENGRDSLLYADVSALPFLRQVYNTNTYMLWDFLTFLLPQLLQFFVHTLHSTDLLRTAWNDRNTAIHQRQRPKEKRDYGTYRNPITKMSAPKLAQYLRLGAGKSHTDSLIVTLFDVNRSTYGRFSTFPLVSSSVLPSVVQGHGQCEDKTESLEGQVNRGTFGKLGTFDRGEPAGQLVNALNANIRIVPYKNAAATDKHCPKVLSIPKLVAL